MKAWQLASLCILIIVARMVNSNLEGMILKLSVNLKFFHYSLQNLCSKEYVKKIDIIFEITSLIKKVIDYLILCMAGDILYAQRRAWNDPDNVLQSWDPTLVNPCTWFHVTCNVENSVVRV